MGIFDSIIGGNSAANTQAATAQGIGDIWQGVTGANQVLGNTFRNAADAYKTGAGKATDALNTAYGGARNDLTGFNTQAQGLLGAGRDSALSTILGGNAGYQPFLTSGQGANTMLANALGLNGAAGHDAAVGAFQTSPGYQFQVDQGIDAAARKAASLGMAGSGNTLDAITRLSTNLADQTYGNWLSNLGGLSSGGLTAAAGQSGNNLAAGTVAYNAGNQGAQLAQQTGTALGTLGMNQGNQLAGIQSNLGNALGGLQTGLGQQKSSNILGGAMGSANLGMQGAQFEDATDNANNGVLSNLLGSIGKLGAVGLLNPSGLTTASSYSPQIKR